MVLNVSIIGWIAVICGTDICVACCSDTFINPFTFQHFIGSESIIGLPPKYYDSNQFTIQWKKNHFFLFRDPEKYPEKMIFT